MMTIFSMLFGAGLALMNERAGSRGTSLRGVYYRRQDRQEDLTSCQKRDL